MAIQTKRERDLEDALKEAGNEAPIQEVTELGAVMDNLDNDTQDVHTKMSNIDFNTRLSKDEINCIMVIDELTRLGILPEDIGITRQKKRLSVSLKGEGRKEKVAIVQGEREHRGGRGIGEKLKGLFTRN
jgi:hypothetical protein